jgi:stearoyl-CoA desaturase (delta-9 desaturase)
MISVTQYTKTDLSDTALLDRPSRRVSEKPARRSERPTRQTNKKRSSRKTGSGRAWRTELNWAVVGWIAILHLGVLAAPFFFSWEAVALTFLLHWITGGLGICLGFHRLLTHWSFQTYRPIKWLFCLVGGLAGEGSVIDWVANHRKHHAHSDQDGDPHSPHDGPWWSHIFWLAFMQKAKAHEEHVNRWSPDLLKDPVVRFIGSMFLPSQFLFAAILGTIGYLYGGWFMCASFVTWGMFVRLCFVLHSTWFVNSASHMWGYKNYETTDDSRNNWWVALLTYGEGWHNNHHAYPRMAPHGHKWWEIDVTFLTIRAMQAVGLAWDVVDYKRRGEKN